jgi:hypothetical protein
MKHELNLEKIKREKVILSNPMLSKKICIVFTYTKCLFTPQPYPPPPTTTKWIFLPFNLISPDLLLFTSAMGTLINDIVHLGEKRLADLWQYNLIGKQVKDVFSQDIGTRGRGGQKFSNVQGLPRLEQSLFTIKNL